MRAMAKKITWAQAGEIIGLCERLPQELRQHGMQSVASGSTNFCTRVTSPDSIGALRWCRHSRATHEACTVSQNAIFVRVARP